MEIPTNSTGCDKEIRMASVVKSIDIARRPEDVFAYATDFSRFPEWQGGVVSARPEGKGSLAVGSRAVVTRRVGSRELARTEEITELNPPRSWAVRGAGGPLVATAESSIQPLDEGRRARLTIALDFEAHGIARFFLPFALRRQAREQLPRNQQRLKESLEREA
jgi:carbon monoxide dehydrogenase subunit G